MLKLNWIFFIFLAISLTACGPVYKTKYSHIPPTNSVVKKCVARCASVNSHCMMQCKLSYRECRQDAHRLAVVKYETYRQAQLIHAQPIEKKLTDFESTSQCHMNCQCDTHFDGCFKTCGGELKPYKVCMAFCD